MKQQRQGSRPDLQSEEKEVLTSFTEVIVKAPVKKKKKSIGNLKQSVFKVKVFIDSVSYRITLSGQQGKECHKDRLKEIKIGHRKGQKDGSNRDKAKQESEKEDNDAI